MKNKNTEIQSRGEIVIYQTKDKKVELEVKLEQETIWLTQAQIAGLFKTERTVITKHLGNIFQSRELDEKSNVQKMHIPFSDKPVKFYNLDVIISVGYRINSARATQFRIWATNVLKKHIIDGYTINEQRLQTQKHKLEALQKTIKLIQNVKAKKDLEHKEISGLLDVISDYSYALELLDNYDKRSIAISRISIEEKFKLTYDSAIKAIHQLKKKFGASGLFGKERDQSFKSSIGAAYQTFDKKDLYPSVEEKAANLLYFIVKNHSFVDGNKRIAASIFLWFLEQNGILYKDDGTKRIADNALVALTLLIAESDPDEKNIIVSLVVNLVNKNN